MHTGRSACATHSQPGIRATHEVNSCHNQTTLGGASLRFLQGCGFFWSFGPRGCGAIRKEKEKEVGSRSLYRLVRDAGEFGMTTLERRRKAKKESKGCRP